MKGDQILRYPDDCSAAIGRRWGCPTAGEQARRYQQIRSEDARIVLKNGRCFKSLFYRIIARGYLRVGSLFGVEGEGVTIELTRVLPLLTCKNATTTGCMGHFLTLYAAGPEGPTPRKQRYGGCVLLDGLSLKLQGPGALPWSLTLGRQDLRFGTGWLVYEAAPLDGSRSFDFDALRLTLDAEHSRSCIGLIYFDDEAQRADLWLSRRRVSRPRRLLRLQPPGRCLFRARRAASELVTERRRGANQPCLRGLYEAG